MTDRLIRITTALAVVAVAGRRGHLLPARLRAGALARRVRHDGPPVAVHRGRADLGGVHGGAGRLPPEPARTTAGRLEPGRWHRGHGRRPTWRMASGTAQSAHWPARGPPWRWSAHSSFLMMLIRTGRGTRPGEAEPWHQVVPPLVQQAPPELTAAPTLEQTVRARHEAGQSQRARAREFNIDRRKVKRILDRAA